jgi:hypothetical protein
MVDTIIVGGHIRGAWRGFTHSAVRPDARISTRTLLTVFDGWRGSDMATASIEVSGPNAERLAGELHAAPVTAIPPGGSVSPVEVERSAKTIWDWWHDRRSEGSRSRSCWMTAPRLIWQAWTENSLKPFSIGERHRALAAVNRRVR